jgi:hypothetical protein
MSEISGSAKFKIYYQMSLHHYFSRMYMYILIEKYLLHSIHINNKLLTSISIHLLKLFVLINYYFFHYLSLEFFVEIPAKKHCRRRWKVIMSLHNTVVSNPFHSVKILLFSSARSRDFDGLIGIELPVSMHTTKTPIDMCRFNVRSST